jgi:hypothetical protein
MRMTPTRAHGAARLAGEPAPDVLDPQRRARLRAPHRILNLIRDATAVVALLRLHDGVEARNLRGRIEQLGKCTAGRNCLRPRNAENSGRIAAPGQNVGCDIPGIRRLADRGHDRFGIDRFSRPARQRIGCEHVGRSRDRRSRRRAGGREDIRRAVRSRAEYGPAAIAILHRRRTFLGSPRCPIWRQGGTEPERRIRRNR